MLVFSTDASRRGGKLSLYDNSASLLANFSFLTLPSKCLFPFEDSMESGTSTTASIKFLYCAVPRNQDQLKTKTLPDDYQKMAIFTADNFLKINLIDGSVEQILADQALDGENLKIFGGNLLFINRLDGLLYAISL